MTEIRNVTVVGAGTMGHSLAQVFAQGGYNVWLHSRKDQTLTRARSLISANLKTLVEVGLVEETQLGLILDRIRVTTAIEEAGKNADLVLEAIFEDEAAKEEVFKTLDRICPPGAILASNTSHMDIFKFVGDRRLGKVVITHWFAPPHIIPLVEIVRGPKTSQETVDTVNALLIKLGKRPVVISKFLPGFIANRLQSALRSEALFLLDNGYATPEDIDTVTKAGFGLRLPILGLLKRMDYAGLDLNQKTLRNDTYKFPPQRSRSESLDQLVALGRLGVKAGRGFYDYGGRSTEELMKERDFKLIQLIEFLKEIGEI